MPAASLLDIVAELLDPSATNPWLVKNVDMVVRILGALYVVTFGVLVWSFTRRVTPRDDGSKKRAEEQAKAITDLTASLESERKRRQNLEIEVEKIKQQLDEQKQRFEKQIDDLLARNRNVIRDASEAAAKALEDLKSSTAASQKALEAAKAAHAEELKALTATAESATKELADVKLEIQAERVKVKQAQADRERLEKEIGKERERAAKLEGQCDRAQKEIDSLSQQMLKMVNESHTSEAASSEAAANSTFIEDLEKSIDALEAAEMATGTPKSLIADMHIQSEEIDSASAALAALERALGGDSDDEKALEAARAAAVAEHDLDHAPPPRVPLPDPSSVPGIILTDAKKDRKKMLTRRVSFGGASAPAAAGLGGGDEDAEADAEAAEAAAEKDAQRTSGEGEQAGSNAVVPFKTFGVKADINKRSRGRRGGGAHGMEDENLCAFPFVDEQRALFCVFDGHAGRDCAVDAKSYFPRELAAALEGHLGDKDVGTLLTTAFRTTDEQLKKHEDMGCTATVVYVWCVGAERLLQCANVGDSTAFLSRNGTAVPLSFDHKATAQAEKQRIRAMGIEVSDTQGRISGLAIARALGDHFLKSQNTGIIGEPTVSPAFLLTAADTLFVLASDGLWDVMSGQEACDLVRDIADPDEAASALLTTAIGKGTTDNITVIVVRL